MEKHTNYRFLITLLLVLTALGANAQNADLSGVVSDPQGDPLIGATVQIQGSERAGTTDEQGRYEFTGIPPGEVTVSVQYIGFKTQEKTVQLISSSVVQLDFTLEAGSQDLGEVVIIGYGTQRKDDLTGSISSVGTEDFQQKQVSTPEQLIAGKVAGVSITSNSGAPGSGSTIRIRGGASLNASNNPLIVLDGVPLSDQSIAGVADPLSMINPNDIESFTVLKDASATAIYGSRASNGVLLITTKKGSSARARINFSTQYSIAQVNKQVDVLSPGEFRTFVQEYGSQDFIDLLGNAETNWQDAIYQTAGTSDNNLSISGTLKNMPYRLSLGYLNQTGVLRTDALERSSVALNLSPSLFDDHLKVNLNVKAAQNNSRFANQDAIKSAVLFDPTQPVRVDSDRFGGFFEWADPSAATGLKQLAPRNPVALLEMNDNRGKTQRSIGNIQLDYALPFLPDLHMNLNLGYDISKGEGTRYVPDSAASHYMRYKDPQDELHGGLNTQFEQRLDNKLLEFYLNYNLDLPEAESRLDAVGGYAYQSFTTRNYNFPDRTADGTEVTIPNFPFDEPTNKLISFYGRINYSYRNRYMLTATVRTDGSSRFSPDHRWATFPSAAFAWRLKQEPFLADDPILSELKVRLGYGITGQQEGIGNYDYISYYNLSGPTSQYEFGDTFYNLYRPGGYYYNRKWEQTATSNLGIDFGLWNNRISGSLDVYYKKTEDLLNLIVQPAGTNFSNQIIANVGDMENKGLELNLQGKLMEKEDLNWDMNLNLTYNSNKITKLTTVPDPNYPGASYEAVDGGTGQMVLINSVGYPRGSFYVYQQVYDRSGKPIDGAFADRMDDDVINAGDLHHYKSIDPKVFLGLSSQFNYRKWSAGFTARGSLGNYVYNNVFSSTGIVRSILNPIGILSNGSGNVLESGLSGDGDKAILSNYYVENGSFLRMDNIHLAYHAGPVFGQTGDLTLQASMQNVFLLTQYKGVDPEIARGVDFNFYPRPQTFMLGLNLSF